MTDAFRSPMTRPVLPESLQAEQRFFDEPAIDRLMGVVMNLATEVFVLRERSAALEAQLAGKAVLDIGKLNAEPDSAEQQARDAEQQAFVSHLLEPLRGTQVTRPASS